MAEASPDSLEHRAPTEFLSSSNQPTSCRTMAAKVNLRNLAVNISPESENMYAWRSVKDKNCIYV